jgi:hypothetical protein
MKRNKRTVVVAHQRLSPLTEHILSQMAQEGAALRRRLERFYRERALQHLARRRRKPRTPQGFRGN